MGVLTRRAQGCLVALALLAGSCGVGVARRFAPAQVARAQAAAKWALRTTVWKLSPEGGEKWFTVHYAVMGGRN